MLIPAAELAADGDPLRNEAASLESWSLEALCSARERDDIWAEIKRREIFSQRELRAIRFENVRTGIRLEALNCIKGTAADIVEPSRDGAGSWYVHLSRGTFGSGSYVVEGASKSTVLYYFESGNPALVVRDADTVLTCGPERCRPADNLDNPLRGPDVSAGEPLPFDIRSSRCGERLCDATVTYRDSSSPLSAPVDIE